jgi:hypothetical protein
LVDSVRDGREERLGQGRILRLEWAARV